MSKVNDKSVGFVQGTVVLMADGKLKPVEKIRPGDWVMSFRTHSPSSPLEPKQVVDTMDYITRDVMEVVSGEDAIMVGRGQLFLSPGMDWTYAHETAYLTDANGNARDFTVTKVNQGNFKIHDIIVDKNHSLVANGFRVHNWGGDGEGTDSGVNTARESTGRAHISAGGSAEGRAVREGDIISGKSSSMGNSPSSNGPTKDSSTSKDAGESSYTGGAGGNDNGGRGDRATPGTRHISSSHRKKQEAPKKAPPPDHKAVAYAAYKALQDTMDYICDIQMTYFGRSFFTVRTAVSEYMKYADALARDALSHVNLSNIGQADKASLASYNVDIVNTHDIIRRSWGNPNDTAINLESIKRACLNVKQFVDRSQGVIGKYIGQQSSSLEYTLPGLAKPAKLDPPTTVTSPEYVKTTANTWVTTGESAAGTTTTPPTSGGIGASFTKTRVVRGYMYAYEKKKGWKKIGPADQKTNWL